MTAGSLSGSSNQPGHLPTIVVVHGRDPDSSCDVRVFVDGVLARHTLVSLDPGAGWTRDQWDQARDEDLSAVHGAGRAVHDAVVAAYDAYGESPYIIEEGEL